MYRFFIACSKGLEGLLFDELHEFNLSHVKQTLAGCYVEADLQQAYTVAMWSRLASRMLLQLGEKEVSSLDEIKLALTQFSWSKVFDANRTFVVDFSGGNDDIRHTQFGAQLVKDCIVDNFRNSGFERPSIDKEDPDIRIAVRVHKDKLTWSLDFTGDGMHKRGYRLQQGEAPLRETLAAAILVRAGIKNELEKDEPVIFDPFCGSGTLVIEAAMMAMDHAPGLSRPHWGFLYWHEHSPQLWHDVLEQAEQRFKEGKKSFKGQLKGSDNNPHLVAKAKDNAKRVLLHESIEFEVADATNREAPAESGLLVCNPPYGERLGEAVETLLLYRRFGRQLKDTFHNWHIAVLAGDEQLLKRLKLRSHKKYPLLNGAIPVNLALYDLTKEQPDFAESQADDLVNRVKKNYSKLSKWANKEGLDCWRVYDADIPEYNAAIDIYQDYVVVQEYAAPKDIPEGVANDRLWFMLESLSSALPVSEDKIILKRRQRQSGRQQYEKQSQESTVLTVNEYGAKFEVNLTDYLDTGLFMDHRLVRKELLDKCEELDVLNLFAYTCTASVQAARAGAARVVSVDMSKTYLKWGERNFALNRLRGDYQFIQADCFSWMREQRGKQLFDVIFLDPPTFSNSKRMNGTLDIQRDHVGLIKTAAGMLKDEGVILFSNNRKKFRIDEEGLDKAGLEVNDQTQASIPEDFKRHKGIHHYFIISRA
jgi:23S rRNA (guanine2445-N2)-methyltransferase / 23S rRNA (guanine2069-N7)-methyltransferase